MCCVVSIEGFDVPPEGGQVLRAVAFPICISASEHTAMRAISPRLVTRERSRGNRNRRRRGAFLCRGVGEGRRSIILSVLVGGISRFGLRGGGCVDKRSSDWNKRERRGSVSSLDGSLDVCAGKDCDVEGYGGRLSEGAGRKCLLGARYL